VRTAPVTRPTDTALATTKPPVNTVPVHDKPKGTGRPKDTIGF
jgi:hypothetical protein